MRCTSCGQEVASGSTACASCGAAVARCASCGAGLDARFRFCPECGQPVHAAPGDGRPQRLGLGERKIVTVLFCDMVGSTALAEKLDPEEFRELLDQYFESVLGQISWLDGYTAQLAGDGVLALFGAPIAHEDAPQRAVRAGLGIRDAVAELGERLHRERGVELRVRIGIHTGPVVVGVLGDNRSMNYTAVGDTANLGARLQALAEPGTVLVSEATRRMVPGMFEMRLAGSFHVRGKAEPVVAYEVLRPCDSVTPIAVAEARGLTPFVGRRAELAALQEVFRKARERVPQVVAVVGETGSGKSRLLYEFRQRLEGEPAIFEARCSSLTQALPYAPFAAMFRSYFDITAADDSGRACEKVRRGAAVLGEQRERFFPYLCRFLALPDGGPTSGSAEVMKQETFEAVARLVMAISREKPVLMLIEDLHWIDESSLEMLEMAVARLRHARLALVFSHRPDFRPRWRTHAAYTEIALEKLAEDEALFIVRSLAGGPLPAELEEQILKRAGRNPFFVEEITRSLIEQGALRRTEGRALLARAVSEIRIPDTIHEVIAARIDRLPPQVKRVTQVASVLGRQFRRDDLEALLAPESIDVGSALEILQERGIVHRKNVLAADEYRFGESLTQEIAYDELLLRERRQLHERIAARIEDSAPALGAEQAALAAHHYSRSENRERAALWLLRAARAAEALPSYPAATRFYEQAWDAAESLLPAEGAEPRQAFRQAMDAAQGFVRMAVFFGSSEMPRSGDAAKRGRELARRIGDAEQEAIFEAFHGLVLMAGDRESFPEGLALIERAHGHAQQGGFTLTASNISRGLAGGYLSDGRFELALRILDSLTAELERLGEHQRLSDLYVAAWSNRAHGHLYADNLRNALAIARQAQELAARAGNRTMKTVAGCVLAQGHFLAGDFNEARHFADRSRVVAEAIGAMAARRTAAIVGLGARLELGEEVDAAGYFEAIEQGHLGPGDMALKCLLAVGVLLMAGEVERAHRFAAVAYGHAGGRLREGLCSVALGDVAVARGAGSFEEARRWYERAVDLGEAIGSHGVLLPARLGQARLALASGDAAEGRDLLLAVRRGSQEIGFGRLARRAEQLLEGAAAVRVAAAAGPAAR